MKKQKWLENKIKKLEHLNKGSRVTIQYEEGKWFHGIKIRDDNMDEFHIDFRSESLKVATVYWGMSFSKPIALYKELEVLCNEFIKEFSIKKS